MISHLSRSVAINTMIFQCGPYRNHSSASRAVVPVGVWRHKRTPLIRCGCQRSLRVVRISVAAAVAWDALCSAFLRPDSVVARYMARQAADTPLRRPARLRSFAPACHRTRLRAAFAGAGLANAALRAWLRFTTETMAPTNMNNVPAMIAYIPYDGTSEKDRSLARFSPG